MKFDASHRPLSAARESRLFAAMSFLRGRLAFVRLIVGP